MDCITIIDLLGILENRHKRILKEGISKYFSKLLFMGKTYIFQEFNEL